MLRPVEIPALPPLPAGIVLPSAVRTRIGSLSPTGGFDGAVAVGMLLRFGGPTLEALLAGGDPVEEHADEWIAELGGQCLSDLTLSRLDGVHAQLDDVLEGRLDDPTWVRDLQSVVLDRDDLASVAWVLRRIHMPIDVDLVPFDQRLKDYLDGMPIEVPLTDPYLIELHHQGETWWTAGPWYPNLGL